MIYDVIKTHKDEFKGYYHQTYVVKRGTVPKRAFNQTYVEFVMGNLFDIVCAKCPYLDENNNHTIRLILVRHKEKRCQHHDYSSHCPILFRDMLIRCNVTVDWIIDDIYDYTRRFKK
ncbi:MAG: hypothetical protein LBP59_10810 [Planctomycetaceae bacterium]|jgi:hypothetical protein|nr:hypothetical protein [Planctomycetaceae bacterium]